MKEYQLYINGEFVKSECHERIEVLNPATEEPLWKVPVATAEDVGMAVRAAVCAQKKWAKTAPFVKADIFRELADLIRKNSETLTDVLIREQGKVRDLAMNEVLLGADAFDFYAGQALRIDGDIIASNNPDEKIFVFKMPIGVIAGILPWNYPFYLIIRKMAPALITGNAIVIKPAPETPGIAYEFAKLVDQSSLPRGLLNIVSGGTETGEALTGHPDIGMITLTGSVRAGMGVMRSAAKNITKVSLELGGKAPVIVMPDADLDKAIEDIYQSRIVNSGQVCSCAERVYVHETVSEEFIKRMVTRMAATRWGDPSKTDELDMGPIISLKQISNIQEMVDKAMEQGARILTGGKRVKCKGYFFEPTVLIGTQEMEIFHKEIFGPVLPIMTFKDFDEAVTLANDCEYGLTSSVFTKDLDIMMRACHELQYGETYINRMHGETVQGFHSGWKKSGIGGSDGKYGLEEYVQLRLVYVKYNSKRK